jgi:hypothetical protein
MFEVIAPAFACIGMVSWRGVAVCGQHSQLNHSQLNHSQLNHGQLNHGQLNHGQLNHDP